MLSGTWKVIATYCLIFLAITLGFIGLYSWLNWNYLIRPHSGFIVTDLSNYWLPFALPSIPVFLFFWVKTRQYKPGLNFLALVSLVSSMCIAPSAIIAQFYLNTATGKIALLNNIGEAAQNPACRYFKIKNHYISKSCSGIRSRERSASRTSWDFEVFICCPVLEVQSDTVNEFFPNWLARHYYTNFGEGRGGDISDKEKVFEQESLKDFERVNLDEFTYLGRIDYNNEYKTWVSAAGLSSKFTESGNNFFFEAFDKPYEARNGNKLFWFFFVLSAGQVVFILMMKYIVPRL